MILCRGQGNTILFCFSQHLPRLRPLKGFFELTRPPTRALGSPRSLLPELSKINDNSQEGRPIPRGQPSRTIEVNLDCALVEIFRLPF